ncbi:MAG: hypothetical protein HQ478_10330 [Chloroflexi bacterium]|nr:hypothetical protein [Chloroflexota bacterium]
MNLSIPMRRESKPVVGPKPPQHKSLFRRIFDDKPEHSLRLRVMGFLAAAWAAFSLISVGVSPIIPLLSIGALAMGHSLSWTRRKKRTPIVSLAVGIFIIVIGVYMRNDLVLAIRGDRIPVAYFLLATAAASSFDLKTRAGLYTQIIASGIVMFFASEIAFGAGFAPLGIIFGLFVLGFLGLAYLEDEFEDAEVDWFSSRRGTTIFWSITGGLILTISIVAFFLLPWNASQAPQAPRFTIVPFSGGDQAGTPGLTPELARQAREQLAQRGINGGGLDSPIDSDNPNSGFGSVSDQFLAELDGELKSPIELGDEDLSLAARVGVPLDPPQFGDPEDAIMYVRSGVSSYWRGRTYDQFDTNDGSNGFGKWYATAQDSTVPDRPIAPARHGEDDGDRYLQTFFPQVALNDEVLTGYEPVAASLPRNERFQPDIQEGSTYQIVSSEPRFNTGELARDRSVWQGPEYAAIPDDLSSIHGLTGEVVGDAETSFEKATRIVSYLNQLGYAEDAPSQLAPNAPLDDFIFGEEDGTALDFATAMTLMSRSAGLTSRLATGYLPGEYNPLSGASKVTAKDAHAWSEIYFDDAGWVPFDPTPRPDLPTESGPPAGAGFLNLSELLDLRLGDQVASAATQAPGAFFDLLRSLVENVQYLVMVVLATLTIGGSIYAILLKINPDLVRRRSRPKFASLDGESRKHVLNTFRLAEKAIASAGFRKREKTETFGAYTQSAADALSINGNHLGSLARAAWQAAYSPGNVPEELLLETEVQLHSLKGQLASLPR